MSFKVDNEKERLLCYAAGILGARISNPTNNFAPTQLVNSSIRLASELIEKIYDDEKLKEILNGAP